MIQINDKRKLSDFKSNKNPVKSVKYKIGVRDAKSCNNLFNNRWANKTNLRIFEYKKLEAKII